MHTSTSTRTSTSTSTQAHAQAHARRLEAGLLDLSTKAVPMDDLLAKVAAIVRPLMQPGVNLRVRIDEARDLRRDCVEIASRLLRDCVESGRKILAAPLPRLDAS